MKNKKVVFILLILFFCLTIYLGNYYRPYIYENNIQDFGLADVGYNIIAVVNMSLLSWTGIYKFTNNKITDILINTGAYLSFELMSYFTTFIGVFDIKDCIALGISGIFSMALLYALDKNSFKVYAEKYIKLE